MYQLDLESGLEQIKKIINTFKPLILRRLKQEVLQELPEKTEHIIQIKLNPQQDQLYQEVRQVYQQRLNHHLLEKDLPAWRHCILEGLLRLRQICCDTRLLGSEAPAFSSCKIEYCLKTFPKVMKGNTKLWYFLNSRPF